MYVHHLKSFHAHVVNQIKLLIFHNGASFQVQQYGLVTHGKNECHFYRPSCGVDSSSGVRLTFRHRPYPLVGTYLHGSDPSGQKSYKGSHQPSLEYRHVGNLS